jgi:hypothetical protein
MERVSFLVEDTGERIACLLNPASLVMRRRAGVHARQSTAGPLTGAALKDDPLLYTGGGATDIEVDLLFDVTLAGSSVTTVDVRNLTRRLFELAEGVATPSGGGKAPLVRFVWGKHWNIPGIVVALAERLEHFASDGAPQRSWLRMRMRRVTGTAPKPAAGSAFELPAPLTSGPAMATAVRSHQLVGSGPPATDTPATRTSGERLDEIAHRYLGDARQWRVLALFNDIDDPLQMQPGRLLRIPLTR